MRQRYKQYKKMTFMVLAAVLVLILCQPMTAFAQAGEGDFQQPVAAAAADPTDPADPIDPTDSTDSTDPTDPADPTDPTDPADPVDPTDPTDPVDPTDSTDPTDPADPTDPTDPTDPAKPTQPAPQYFSTYRVETDASGVRTCWWYGKDGVKREAPETDACFIVKFDKGSSTEGTAVHKVGRSGTLWYFNKKGRGKKYTGWFKQSGKKYYFKKGKRYKGTRKIKKIWYVFSKKNGQLSRKIGDDVDKNAQSYSSRTSYLIVVKLKEHRTRIYRGHKGSWNRIHKWKCTTGKPSTPTVRGSFTIGARGLYFNTGTNMRCWYYTQFRGNYLFHSVLYDRSPSPVHVVSGRLGVSASHGCIRLKLSNAKWIYRNIPRGTRVRIY